MDARMSISEASKILRMNPEKVRYLIQVGALGNAGIYIPPREGGERGQYIVFRKKFNEWVGIENEQTDTSL